VVAGFGFGALVLLLGIGLRDVGPRLRGVRPGAMLPWTDVQPRLRWGRGCRATGLVLALGAGAVCLVTTVALLAQVGDRVGGAMVAGTAFAAALATIGWAFVYANHERRLWSPTDASEPIVGARMVPERDPLDDPSNPRGRDADPAPVASRPTIWPAQQPAVAAPRREGRIAMPDERAAPIRSSGGADDVVPASSPLGDWSPAALRIMAGSSEFARNEGDDRVADAGRVRLDPSAEPEPDGRRAEPVQTANHEPATRSGRA